MNTGDIRYKNLRWEFKKLYYQKDCLVELIPHENVKYHWHLKFAWRDEKTPEFFNLTNAKENSINIVLHRLNHGMPVSLAEARTAI